MYVYNNILVLYNRELKLPACVPLDRLNTFLAMYRAHHQHLHQAIVRWVTIVTRWVTRWVTR